MTGNKFKETLEALLKKDIRLVDDNKELNLSMVRELADKTDEKLIELLLNNSEIKKKFFLKVKEVFVFKSNDFKFFLDANQIDNSYTAYENRIGLSRSGRLLKDIGDVVLNFPYKDCVLEGGQSTEEGIDEYYEYDDDKKKYADSETKREEIFFNEILAEDEIDRLFEPKAFTNLKKHSTKKEENIKKFERDEEGFINDNLLIKGNNLLALHSIEHQFIGNVKLIYIDPPYNREADTFYNDSFKHSTWLTFMYNRLTIAKNLLSSDGTIWINIDDNECHYLKIICDSIFGRENFVGSIAWQKFHSVKSNAEHNLSTSHDYLLIYALNKEVISFQKISMSKQALKVYKNPDDDPRKLWRTAPLTVSLLSGSRGASFERTGKSNGLYVITAPNGKKHKPTPGRCWISKKTFEFLLKDKRIWWGKDGNAVPMQKIFLNEKGGMKNISTFWTHVEYGSNKLANEELKKLFPKNIGKKLNFSTPKPEQLLKRIIEISTNENDIILDFFAGSGTTAAVAHKMNRKWIIVEQMDYIESITLERLKKVITGEQGGISKAVNWKGGGSFIYLELAKWNEEAKEKIVKCKTLKEIEKLLNELSEKYFLNYNVKFKEFQERIIKEESFVKLPLKKQQEMCCKMLDLNQLYVNASEMEDKKYGLSKEDIALTKDFYKSK